MAKVGRCHSSRHDQACASPLTVLLDRKGQANADNTAQAVSDLLAVLLRHVRKQNLQQSSLIAAISNKLCGDQPALRKLLGNAGDEVAFGGGLNREADRWKGAGADLEVPRAAAESALDQVGPLPLGWRHCFTPRWYAGVARSPAPQHAGEVNRVPGRLRK